MGVDVMAQIYRTDFSTPARRDEPRICVPESKENM